MSLAGLSLRDLEYLVAVAERRHFGRAARHCGVSQPALSAQIRKLEALLGVEVFERAPGGVLVTLRGHAIVAAARSVIEPARALLDLARATDAEPLAGPLRIGAIPTLGPYLLPRVLRPVREAFPAARPVLSEGRSVELAQALRDDRLDAALVCLPVTDPALLGFPLFTEPLLLMHEAAERDPAWPLNPAAGRLLLMSDGHCLTDHALAACGDPGPVSASRRAATGLEMLRHMVAAGEGVALVPALAATSLGTMNGLLRYSRPQDMADGPTDPPGRTVAMVVRRRDPRGPVFTQLAALLRSATPPPAVAVEEGQGSALDPLGAAPPDPHPDRS